MDAIKRVISKKTAEAMTVIERLDMGFLEIKSQNESSGYAIELCFELIKNKAIKKQSVIISISQLEKLSSMLRANLERIFSGINENKEDFFKMMPTKQ